MRKIRFERKQLIDALKFGGMFAGTTKTMPILDNVRITFDDDAKNASFESTNLDVSTKERVSCDVLENTGGAEYCLEPKGLLQLLATLADESVVLLFEEKKCTVMYSNGKAEMPLANAIDYPSNHKRDGEEKRFAIDMAQLLYIIGSSQAFLGNDELRPTMMCLRMSIKGTDIEYAATDAHKLVSETVRGCVAERTADELTILIPKGAMHAIAGMVTHGARTALMTADNSLVTVSCGERSIVFTPKEGKFPNVEPIVSGTKDNDKRFTVNQTELRGAIRRAALCASISTNTIRMKAEGNYMFVSSDDIDMGRQMNESVALEGSDFATEAFEFGANAYFFLSSLDGVGTENVTITAKARNKAITIYDSTRPDKTIIVMPVMLT